MQSAGIQDQRPAFPVRLHLMCMAIADQIIFLRENRFLKPFGIVAMKKGDPFSIQIDLSELSMAELTRLRDGQPQIGRVRVAVSEHEMCRPAGKQRNDAGGNDITTVQDRADMLLFQQCDGLNGCSQIAVRITDDADFHRGRSSFLNDSQSRLDTFP